MSEFDQKLGMRLRLLRQERGVSRERLAEILDISVQQLQKYEAGSNRISPERLQKCAEFLDVPIGYFFGTLGGDYAAESVVTAIKISEIPSEDVRVQLHGLVQAIERLSKLSELNPGFINNKESIPLDAGN